MKKSSIQIVIAFSILALLGSIAVQYYWIRELYHQNKFLFDQNINTALNKAVKQIQNEEDKYRINRFLVQAPIINKKQLSRNIRKQQDSEKDAKKRRKAEVIVHSNYTQKHSNNFKVLADSSKSRIFQSENEIVFLNDKNIETSIQIKIENDSVFQRFETKADSLIQVLEYKTYDIAKEKEKLESTIDQLVWEMDDWSSPFFDSIPAGLIENVLKNTMNDFGLPETFEFAVKNKNDRDNFLYQSTGFTPNQDQMNYISNLYPDYLIPRQQILILQIPSNLMYYKMSGPVLLSLFFTLMLAAGLWLIIKNMIHHRNISQIQNDFINNMTHEFKTPIATISLASDSILNPGILDNREKVSYFTGMIKKENKRMNRLVEKILQMARLENKEFKLEKQKVAVHDILEMISENTKIKLNESGNISLNTKAKTDTILADQVHLTNVFYNLIDNAIKYSDEPKNIEIESLNQKNYLVVRIKDNGHGMSKKELQHIFDRFYRIEAGNVHNIKGYGLGLTYVKAVIDKHNGQINVKSEEGIGSTFEIKFPL